MLANDFASSFLQRFSRSLVLLYTSFESSVGLHCGWLGMSRHHGDAGLLVGKVVGDQFASSFLQRCSGSVVLLGTSFVSSVGLSRGLSSN